MKSAEAAGVKLMWQRVSSDPQHARPSWRLRASAGPTLPRRPVSGASLNAVCSQCLKIVHELKDSGVSILCLCIEALMAAFT